MSVGLALLLFQSVGSPTGLDIEGRWLISSEQPIVMITPCGEFLCAKVERLNRPALGEAKDRFNPDPKLRGRPLSDVPVLFDLRVEGEFWRGKYYAPAAGHVGDTIVQRDGDRLKVGRCVPADEAPKLACLWNYWERSR